jgi:type II secretory pathway component PulJ
MLRTRSPRRREAFSLVELIAATTILATLTTSSFMLVRTANNAWVRHRDDTNRRREAVVVLQHLMRRVRQASKVTAITAANDPAGAITLSMPSGSNAIWARNGGTNQVMYGTTSANNLLANNITEMTLTGLKVDGVTATTTTDLIHCVKCTMKYTLSRPTGNLAEAVSCSAWLRAW